MNPKKSPESQMLEYALERSKQLGHDMHLVSKTKHLAIYSCNQCRKHIEVWTMPAGCGGEPLVDPCWKRLKIQVPVP